MWPREDKQPVGRRTLAVALYLNGIEKACPMFPTSLTETTAFALKAAGARTFNGISQDQIWKVGWGTGTQMQCGGEHLYLRLPINHLGLSYKQG